MFERLNRMFEGLVQGKKADKRLDNATRGPRTKAPFEALRSGRMKLETEKTVTVGMPPDTVNKMGRVKSETSERALVRSWVRNNILPIYELPGVSVESREENEVIQAIIEAAYNKRRHEISGLVRKQVAKAAPEITTAAQTTVSGESPSL